MTKSELINRLCIQHPDLDPKQVALAVNTLLEHMNSSLTQGTRIEIRDFGSWFTQYCAERDGHNPKTQEKVHKGPTYKVRFKAGKALRERVNASKHLPIQSHEDNS